jgi:outer membrane protein OmpA-like peptidoglycan-associated protein
VPHTAAYLKGRLAMAYKVMFQIFVKSKSGHYSYRDSGRIPILRAILVLALSLLSSVAFAQDKAQGMIKARNGSTIILQTTTAEKYLNVILQDTTTVAQNEGVFKARKKTMSMAALIPGLEITVEGHYDENRMLVAKSIKFNGNDLERAYSIQAGLSETEARSKANQEEAARHAAELEKQNAALKEQNAALAKQQAKLKEQEAKIAANKVLIEANTARFGQLDDYYIYDRVTVLFANGKSAVDPKYNPQLTALAEKATTVEGHMIQVKGFASASGTAALNQRMSEERAAAVTNILLQQGHVPLSRMLAPGAMGESQAKDTKKASDEAEDRKVVVQVLQNKGIAGIK